MVPINEIASKHHKYYSQKALKSVCVEVCRDPKKFIDEWIQLYGVLVDKYDIKGIKAFSKKSFEKQFEVPGFVLFRAEHGGETVGAHTWYLQDNVAYSHLAAFSPLGYELMASYALYWFALEYFSNKVLYSC